MWTLTWKLYYQHYLPINFLTEVPLEKRNARQAYPSLLMFVLDLSYPKAKHSGMLEANTHWSQLSLKSKSLPFFHLSWDAQKM